MVRILLLGVCGFFSGVLGGMGMGGGTILIPMLTLFFKIDAHASAAINLISFIPTAVVSLIFHVKNKLVKKEGIAFIVVPALLLSVGASYLAKETGAGFTLKIFGAFLIAVSLCGFLSSLKND